MLKRLYIENIAVIECADILFMDGFNVLSGETGAGKSIIIDSLNAILGNRVSRELIRTGQSKACVSATFCHLSPVALETAAQLGYEAEDGELLVRRDIYSDGKNTCRINGQPATLSILKTLGDKLINIHGQHDGQHLLNELLHIDYLDAFGCLDGPLEEYLRHYEELLQLNRTIKSLSMNATEKERRLAQLKPQQSELAAAAIQPGEQDLLLSQRSSLILQEKESAGIISALTMLDGTDDAGGTVQQLSQISKVLTNCEKYAPSLAAFAARARELDAQTTALSQDLADALLRMEYSPQQLSDTEARLDLIHRLVTKYATPADELEALLAAVETEIHVLENAEDNIDELKTLYADKRRQVFTLSEQLHQLRQQAAEQMTTRIETEMRELDMPAARFAVEITSTQSATQTKFTKKGTDTVRFLLSANSGEELRPLSKVASGGELSRIMLALKNVLSAGEESITAVFDEIDTGVSGRAASRVGEKLYAIAQQRQVLCVTHLPQIACLADHQYRIIKFSENGRTFTQVNLLDTEGRVDELARLTAGIHITEATRNSARELLQQAQTHKKS